MLPSNQKLTFGTAVLEDALPIEMYGIQNGSRLTMVDIGCNAASDVSVR